MPGGVGNRTGWPGGARGPEERDLRPAHRRAGRALDDEDVEPRGERERDHHAVADRPHPRGVAPPGIAGAHKLELGREEHKAAPVVGRGGLVAGHDLDAGKRLPALVLHAAREQARLAGAQTRAARGGGRGRLARASLAAPSRPPSGCGADRRSGDGAAVTAPGAGAAGAGGGEGRAGVATERRGALRRGDGVAPSPRAQPRHARPRAIASAGARAARATAGRTLRAFVMALSLIRGRARPREARCGARPRCGARGPAARAPDPPRHCRPPWVAERLTAGYSR